MDYARQALDESDDIAFAHRYITRPPHAGDENHVALSEREFTARMRMDFFALHWYSHGLHYGVGVEIDVWLSRGCVVVVNGSRAYYPEARRRYPRMLGLLIETSAGRLRTRLSHRAREAPGDIRARLARNEQLAGMSLEDAVRLRNDGSLREAGDRFIRCILQSKDVL